METIKPKVIAEIGCVHAGSLDRAKELADLVKLCGADFIKTQKRCPIESVPKKMQNLPHPNERFSYGKTYLEHREKLELSIAQHAELKRYCERIGLHYSSSVWDITSAHEIISLKPHHIKIPSACNSNFALLDTLFENYEGKIHISTGMTDSHDMLALQNYLSDKVDRVVIYHCTSEYPCPFERLYLNELKKLADLFPGAEIGFSDHGFGIAADIAAFMLGATWIERHFVDDRTFRHTDASVSLEPDGLRRLCRDLKAVEKTLRYKESMSEEEKEQCRKLKGK